MDANGVHIPGNWGVCNDFCPTEKKGSNSDSSEMLINLPYFRYMYIF